MNLDFNKTKNSVSDGNKTKTTKETFGLEEMLEWESGIEELSESESQQVIGGVDLKLTAGNNRNYEIRLINTTIGYSFGGREEES